MNKKIISYALATVMIGSLFTLNVQAKQQSTTSLPVQFYDFDADGLFYEYALNNGMDTFGLRESTNGEVTKGLIEDTLDEDGLPVYKRTSVEAAAKTIQKNLGQGKADLLDETKTDNDRIYTSYNIFKHFTNKTNITDPTYTKMFGEQNEQIYFYNLGWNLEKGNTDAVYGTGTTLHTGVGTIWKHDTDGVINYGLADTLTKEVDVTAGQVYKFDCWRLDASGPIKYRIYDTDENHTLLNDNQTNVDFTPTTNKVIIEIYRDDTSGGEVKISIPKLTNVTTGVVSDNYLGDNIENNFLKNGWKSKNYENVSKDLTNGKLYEEGVDYWQQDGNGLYCLQDSSLTFKTNDSTNQMLKIRYWLNERTESTDSLLSIDILDDRGVLTSEKIKNNGGFNDCFINVPQGEGNIKIRINGKAGAARIADMSVTPLGTVLELGDYEKTVEKYNQGKLKSVDDCTSCMDYAYLRLKNYYNINFSMNRKANKYNKMVLKKESTARSNELTYCFDSAKKIKYNDDGTFYNDTNESGDGFFPLDYIEGAEKVAHDHNYNFGMIVDGDFIYRKGANQYFYFSGDDDVYVFINGKLAVDLGGAHIQMESKICVDDFAEENGINNGEKCEFKMFYLERHTDQSNCNIKTNLNIGKRVEYKFESGTEGMELPEEVLNLTPVDEEDYYDGTTVNILDKNKKFDNIVDSKNNGIWKFIGWDKESKVMEGDGIQFVGKWIFVANDTLKPNEPTNDNKQDPKDNTDKKDNPQVSPVVSGNLPDTEVKATSSQKVKKSSKVKTGDDTSILIYGFVVVISALGIVFLKKKAHN